MPPLPIETIVTVKDYRGRWKVIEIDPQAVKTHHLEHVEAEPLPNIHTEQGSFHRSEPARIWAAREDLSIAPPLPPAEPLPTEYDALIEDDEPSAFLDCGCRMSNLYEGGTRFDYCQPHRDALDPEKIQSSTFVFNHDEAKGKVEVERDGFGLLVKVNGKPVCLLDLYFFSDEHRRAIQAHEARSLEMDTPNILILDPEHEEADPIGHVRIFKSKIEMMMESATGAVHSRNQHGGQTLTCDLPGTEASAQDLTGGINETN